MNFIYKKKENPFYDIKIEQKGGSMDPVKISHWHINHV